MDPTTSAEGYAAWIEARERLWEIACQRANAIHAITECSICERPGARKGGLLGGDVEFDETEATITYRDPWGDDLDHYLTIPAQLIYDTAAFERHLAELTAAKEAAEREAAAKAEREARRRAEQREAAERETLRRLAAQYPEELAGGAA